MARLDTDRNRLGTSHHGGVETRRRGEHPYRTKANPAASRFEMASGDAVAFVEHTRAGDRIVLAHAEVPEALSGRGVGSKLVRGVLDGIRREGTRVVPRCEFVAACIGRHPEYRDLLADEG